MTITEAERRRRERRDDLALVNVGFFLFLIGLIYALNPGVAGEVVDFFRDLRLTPVVPGVLLPAPGGNHPGLYYPLSEFSFVYGIFHVAILAARFVIGSPLSQKASTVSGIIFWPGLGFFFLILGNGTIAWFEFVTGVIILIGLGLVAQGAALAAGRSLARPRPYAETGPVRP